jgi:hypothetical protein
MLVPDFDAEIKFPYRSNTTDAWRVVGHNLIHRNCEEVDKSSLLVLLPEKPA